MAKKELKRSTVHIVAATVFAIVTFVHAMRLAMGWPMVLGTVALPMWLSWLGIFVAGSLAVWLWNTSTG